VYFRLPPIKKSGKRGENKGPKRAVWGGVETDGCQTVTINGKEKKKEKKSIHRIEGGLDGLGGEGSDTQSIDARLRFRRLPAEERKGKRLL